MLIIVQVERRLSLSGKMHDLYFQPNKICYQSKNYIILKLVQSTIQIFNQPHSNLSLLILYCSLWVHVKYFKRNTACTCACPPFSAWLAKCKTTLQQCIIYFIPNCFTILAMLMFSMIE